MYESTHCVHLSANCISLPSRVSMCVTALTLNVKDSFFFFFFALTFTALCVHQGRDLLLAQLTQPIRIPGWVEVHRSLSTNNKGDGKQESAKQGKALNKNTRGVYQ